MPPVFPKEERQYGRSDCNQTIEALDRTESKYANENIFC
jgi:hypothetical protein